ncbi:MAG: DUF1778 domain-containing protein [Bifidobacteriaceae bacterium]|jgi:uncharacterized protein (DUF1778 family)|nr:DUF1778 domain-containing protein [Bifidobacteriaceae bacterium]
MAKHAVGALRSTDIFRTINTMAPRKGEQKSYRIDMRLTAEQRAQIDRAAGLKGMNLTQWALNHLLEAARSDIRDETAMALSAEAFDAFEKTLDEGPKFAEAAKELLAIEPHWADGPSDVDRWYSEETDARP